MNSFLKGVLHTAIGLAIGAIVQAILKSPVASLSVGTVVTFLGQWATSHFIPTTTGASASQS